MIMREKIERSRANAERALDAYRWSGGVDPDDQAAIRDLVVDLLHLNESLSDQPSHNRYVVAQSLTRVALDDFGHESDPANADEHV